MSQSNQQPFAGIAGSPNGVVAVRTLNMITLNVGSPVGTLAGQSGNATTAPDIVWDWVDATLWICTQTGTAATAVWTQIGGPGTFSNINVSGNVTAGGAGTFHSGSFTTTLIVGGAATFNGTLGATAGGSLAGTFTGSPTLSGNPTFSGNPVLSGNPNFSGAPTFASLSVSGTLGATGGGSLGGTFTGAPTLSGAVVFSGNPSFSANPTFSGNPNFSGAPTFSTIAASGLVTASAGLTVSGASVVPLEGYIAGLNLSNDGTLPNTVLDVAAGVCTDSTNTVSISLGAFTKSTAGSWVAGSGNNGMGVGLTIAASTWYFVFAIIRSGVADVYIDTSATAANKPAGTTAFRRIGEFLTDGSAHILSFYQNGDIFEFNSPILDISLGAWSTNTCTMSVPPILCVGIFQAQFAASVVGTGCYIYRSNGGANATATIYNQVASVAASSGRLLIPIDNTSKQIKAAATAGSSALQISTLGWIDTRGRFA